MLLKHVMADMELQLGDNNQIMALCQNVVIINDGSCFLIFTSWYCIQGTSIPSLIFVKVGTVNRYNEGLMN